MRRSPALRPRGAAGVARRLLAGGAAPLRLPVFRRITAAYVVNELGNWLGELALAILVYDHTGSALATAGLFLCARLLPSFAGPVVTAALQHRPPGRAVPALYAGQAVLYAALAWLAGRFSLAGVLVLAALDGALMIAAKALARSAMYGVLAPRGALRDGNAVLNVAFTTCAAVGPALAGAAVAGLGARGALLLDAGSFLAAAVVFAGLRVAAAVTDEEESSLRERLAAGLRYARGTAAVRAPLLGQGALLVFFAAVTPVEVVLVKGTLNGGDAAYGAFLACWGVGMAAGGVVFAAGGARSLRAMLLGGTVAIGAGYVAVGVAPGVIAACVAAAVGGMGNGVQWVALLTTLQIATSEERLPAVMALFEALSTVMPGIGFLVGGAAAAIWSPRVSFLVAGAGVLLLVPALPSLFAAQPAVPAPDAASEPERA